MEPFNLCIIKPNKDSFSETFIQAHIDRIPANKKVLYGGVFPVYDDQDQYLIKGIFNLLSYLIQKKLFNKLDIKVRTLSLAKYLRTNKIDVVLAEYGMVGGMVTKACQQANVPLVVHFHGADAHHRDTVALYSDFYQAAFKYASAIVVVSEDMAASLKAMGAPADKVILNPYGVDTAKFSIADVASSGIEFLAVGRFVEKKSPTSVIKAFKEVVEKFPDAHLQMVGDGPLFNATKQYTADIGLADKVTFTGALSSTAVQLLMQHARCFVQHSVTAADGDMEGTPNTILEAGASGLAIVSTQHAGIKEAVINGETGYLVPEYDINGMANYMIKIAGDVSLATSLGAKEAAYIRKNYNIEDRINKLTAILKQAIKNN